MILPVQELKNVVTSNINGEETQMLRKKTIQMIKESSTN